MTSTPLSVEQALRSAADHHRAGNLAEAEQLYRAVLQAQPNQPNAHHNLGVLALQMGRDQAALGHFQAALEASPGVKKCWLSYAEALIRAGQPLRARETLANARQRGMTGPGLDELTIKAESSVKANEWFLEAVGHHREGRIAEADGLYRRILEVEPNHPATLHNIGSIVYQAGRFDEAEAIFRNLTAIKPDYAEAHSSLARVLRDLGRLPEAEAGYRRALELRPDFAEAWSNLGTVLTGLDCLEEAEASFRRALELQLDSANAYCNLGNAVLGLGRQEEAESCYRRALEIHPDFAIAHGNLGGVLRNFGRLGEAETSCRRALEIMPTFAEAWCNLGDVLHDLGRQEEAEASYRRALEIRPDLAAAWCSLGDLLGDLGRVEEAEASYRRAMTVKPRYFQAYGKLAQLLMATLGDESTILDLVLRALQIKENRPNRELFVQCLSHMRCTSDDSNFQHLLVRALSEPWGRPQSMARFCADFVKLDRHLAPCLARAVAAWPERLPAQRLFEPAELLGVAANPLLRVLLETTPICDLDLERFLTMIRHALLDGAVVAGSSDESDEGGLGLYCALARQCFVNEYVFAWTEEESVRAQVLRERLAEALAAGTEISVRWLIAVATYFPLHLLPLAGRLLDREWPERVSAVLVQQIREPDEERRLRTTIPRLTAIEDAVSGLVREQYEENPYPRWVLAPPASADQSVTIDAFLRHRFPFATIRPLGREGGIDVLVAGCGTGQHPIETAQRVRGVHVLAIDLSLASLAYAKRKTQELGLNNIAYAQADLLNLGSIGRRFAVIEVSGVLHHLADPWEGWRGLLALLEDGGFMKLGLYSAVARRNVVRARAFIAEQGYQATAEDIRRCRQEIMAGKPGAILGPLLTSFSDLNTTSECRDLLFHVQEHRLTLADIKDFLSSHGLQFLGFDVASNILHAYQQRFPGDRAAIDLDSWQTFENDHPATFSGMYQFWIQKGGSATGG